MICRRGALIALLALVTAGASAAGQQFGFLTRPLKEVVSWAREDTNDAQRIYVLAIRHWREHHWGQVDSLLRLAVQLEPRYTDPYLALYFLPYARRPTLWNDEGRGRVPDSWKPILDEAHRFYQRAIRIDPMVNLQIMSVAFEIEEPTVRDFTGPEWLAYERYYAWFVDLGLGRYRSARDRLRKLGQQEYDEAKHPDRVPDFVLWYRGLAEAHTLQFDSALSNFRALLERSLKTTQRDEIIHVPLQDNEYRFVLANLHDYAGHTDSAVALYQEALEHDLGLVMAHRYLAGIYDRAHRADDVLLELRRAAEISSDDPTAHYELATALFNSGFVDEAKEPLRNAVAMNARYSPPYYLLGRVAEDDGRLAEAREQYARFLALAPLRLEALRADATARLGQLPK
jgi:tetratricopeptide (TPR) repeat protein